MPFLQRRTSSYGPASSSKRRSFKHTTASGKVVVASAMPVDLNDRGEVARVTKTRQEWQREAWVYRRALGELRYATKYLGNSCMRLRLYTGTYVPGSQVPVELTDTERHGLPADLVDAAISVLQELSSNSPVGQQTLIRTLTENFQVAGECYLVGQQNNEQRSDGRTPYDWRVHSISEITSDRQGNLGIKDFPGATGNDVRPIDLSTSKVSRLWTPDPEWGLLADSPFRGILDLAEELLLLGRDVRATVRSRLANNGLLLIPDDLTVVSAGPEGDDDEDDEFFASLLEAAESNITNEGDAGGALPIVVRGPAEGLKNISHLKIDRPQNKFNIQQRTEIIQRIATSIDLPAEVLTGKIDLNHWSAWQVDDDTFRHHIEPTSIEQVGALTIGFLWRELKAMNRWAPDLVEKILVWYDPTELVTHPDRTNDGFQLWDRFAISDDALRRIAGFSETDAPTGTELAQRMAFRMRTMDPNVQAQIIHEIDPTIEVPAETEVLPGRQTNQNPDAPAPDPGPPADAAASAQRQREMALKLSLKNIEAQIGRSPVVASAPVDSRPDTQLSRSLLDIDRRLRDKVHTAANTSIRRVLEKAGARVVSKTRGAAAATIRESIADVPVARVPAAVGPRILASLGLTEDKILDAEYTEMHRQWEQWVKDAQSQALRDAVAAAELDFDIVASSLAKQNADNRAEGWVWLQKAMHETAVALLTEIDDELDLTTADLIGVGDIRAAVGLAGGFGDDGLSSGLGDDGRPIDPEEMLGQIGSGDTVQGVLSANGFSNSGYEWVWGGSMNAFGPHLALNGTIYSRWDDSALASNDPMFPGGGQYFPGDHSGCSCDFMPIITRSPTASQ